MIVDCHGHFTTAPAAHSDWRQAQLAAYAEHRPAPAYPTISDDEIRACLADSQVARMDERGIDLTLFSPRASTMGHHVPDEAVSLAWTRHSNDLVARAVALFPDRFAGVAALPQAPGVAPERSVAELRRCVEELGFVGVNLDPDPSGGHTTSPPLTDPHWFGLYDALVDLDVPAMVHVSASTVPGLHSTGAYYLNADTTALMQLVEGDLFERYPTLRLVLPHGGGAAAYHWGRFRGLADMLGRPDPTEAVLGNVWFDTCVYHQPGVDLLVEVIGPEHLLFGSETFGAVRGTDPRTGHAYDDTRRYLDAAPLTDQQRSDVLGGNALAVYPRLANHPVVDQRGPVVEQRGAPATSATRPGERIADPDRRGDRDE